MELNTAVVDDIEHDRTVIKTALTSFSVTAATARSGR